MPPEVRDSQRLQEILSAFYAGRTTRDETRSELIDVVLGRMHCARVTLWKFDGEGEDLGLLRFASKTAGGVLDTSDRRLCRSEYRDYFNALIEKGVFLSDDAMSAPALEPMRASYLVPQHVLSTLDAAFMLNGRAYGAICCEETASIRHWRQGDVAALRAIVTKMALMMSGAPESILWVTPSMPLRAMAATSAATEPTRPARSPSDRRG